MKVFINWVVLFVSVIVLSVLVASLISSFELGALGIVLSGISGFVIGYIGASIALQKIDMGI